MLKKLRRSFGITAPRVAVHTHIAWYWRWLALMLVAGVVFGFVWTAYDIGGKFAGFDRGQAESEIGRLGQENGKLQQDISELRNEMVKQERQLEIEHAAHQELRQQIKTLADENAELKEDLAFFQTLMPASGKEGGLSVNRFKLLPDAMPGEYRYRLLLLQAAQRAPEFQGYLQLVVRLEQDGKDAMLALPAAGKESGSYRLGFKFYQRIEGGFKVSPEAVVKSVQIRVFENGATVPKLTKNFSL